MTPDDILQFSKINGFLSHHERGFPPAADGNRHRDHSQMLERERTLGHSALNVMIPFNPSPQSSGKPAAEKVQEPERWRIPGEQVP